MINLWSIDPVRLTCIKSHLVYKQAWLFEVDLSFIVLVPYHYGYGLATLLLGFVQGFFKATVNIGILG